MRARASLLAAILGLLATDALAQAPPEPPALELPVGAPVRIRTQAAPGDWIKGVLAGADSGTIAFVPEGAPPLGPNQLRIPRETVTRLEIVTGKKRQWLPGLVIGTALGVAMGFAVDVDPVRCEFDDNYACSRGEAVGLMGSELMAAIGGGVGSLVRKDVWTPVGLDALGPPPARRHELGRRAAGRARRAGGRPVRAVLRREGGDARRERTCARDKAIGRSLALVAGCVLSCACATTRYTQSRIEAVPPDVKGHAGSRASVEIEGLKIRIESLDRTPVGRGLPAPGAAARLRAARARVLVRPGPGRPAGREGGRVARERGRVPAALPGRGVRSRFDVAVTPETRADLVLGGLARGPKRLAPVTLRLARHAGRSYDRLYWLEAIGYVLSAAAYAP